MRPSVQGRWAGNLSGLLAVLMWSAAIPVMFSLTQKVGTFRAGVGIHFLAGSLLLAFVLLRARIRPIVGGWRFSLRYVVYCGIPFVLNLTSLYIAVGTAANERQVVEVCLINYLWPALMLVTAVLLGKERAISWLLALGIATALTGVAWASFSVNEMAFSLTALAANVVASPLAYAFALLAACTWAIYSIQARTHSALAHPLHLPIFLFLTSAALGSLYLFFPFEAAWDRLAIFEFIALALFPCAGSYICWAFAMKRGDLPVVASLGYLTPLLSTLATLFYLSLPFRWEIGAAALLVVLGAWIGKKSMRRKAEDEP